MAGNNWVIEVKQKLHMVDVETETQNWSKRSIYRVPACAKDLNQKAYSPQTVSFGPYHYGEKPLLPMEEHKERALLHFLARTKTDLQSLVDSFTKEVQVLQDSYDKLDESWKKDTDKFIQMMILDGCFLFEILLFFDPLTDNDYAENDPVFGKCEQHYLMALIKRDMLMLENQLPVLVLYKLLEAEGIEGEECCRIVNQLITCFWFPHLLDVDFDNFLHVLDGYRKCLLGEKNRDSDIRASSCIPKIRNCLKTAYIRNSDLVIRSATELDAAGIKFEKSETKRLNDISFHSRALNLPVIEVDDTFESIFLNLMSFEVLHVDASNEVSSYIFFMSKTIDNERDVALLRSRRIIQTALGSDKAVVKLFNSLSRDIDMDHDSRPYAVCRLVMEYCEHPFNKCRAHLTYTYFRQAWSVLSFVAALILFVLTIAQTVYTIYPYYNPNSRR